MSPQFRFSALMLAVILLLLPLNAVIYAEEGSGEEPAQMKETTTSTTEETNQVETATEWVCPYCGQVNSSKDTICVFCHSQNPANAQTITEQVSAQIKIETEKDKKKLQWLCPQCGKYNLFGATECFYCGEIRPPTTSSNYQLFYPLYHHPTMHKVSKGMIIGGVIALGYSMASLILAPFSGGEAGIGVFISLIELIPSGAILAVGIVLNSISKHTLEMIPVNPADYKNLGYNSLDSYRLLTERPRLSNDCANLFAVGFEF